MTKKDRPWGHRTDLLEIGDFHEGHQRWAPTDGPTKLQANPDANLTALAHHRESKKRPRREVGLLPGLGAMEGSGEIYGFRP